MSAKNPDNFDELLKSLDAVGEETKKMAKPGDGDDDKTVKAAAKEGDGDDEGSEGGEDGDEGEGGDGDDVLGKSLGTDGEGNDLVDATELLKSLLVRQDNTEGTLAKAISSMVGVVSKQNDLIKSLQADVKSMSTQGRGRKTLLVATEKPGVSDVLAKSGAGEKNEGEITPEELLVKCDVAYKGGAITGAEFNTVDVCLRNSWPIAPAILNKIAAAAK